MVVTLQDRGKSMVITAGLKLASTHQSVRSVRWIFHGTPLVAQEGISPQAHSHSPFGVLPMWEPRWQIGYPARYGWKDREVLGTGTSNAKSYVSGKIQSTLSSVLRTVAGAVFALVCNTTRSFQRRMGQLGALP